MVQECREFAGRVHHSSLDQQRIRRECQNLLNDSNPVECQYRKVITDVSTRWNLTFFLHRSIHQLRPALESLKEEIYEDQDKTDAKFKNLIPTPLTFQIIEQILPIMEKACQISEMMSTNSKPTIHLVVVMLANLQGLLEKEARDGTQSFAKDYAEVMIKELDIRFPNVGTDNELYAFGQILHPYYRGRLFRRGTES